MDIYRTYKVSVVHVAHGVLRMLPKEEYLEMQSRFYDSLVNLPPSINKLLHLKRSLDSHNIPIDFSRKEPEVGWQLILDRFFLSAVPVWFDWLKWIMIVAALMVIAEKSENVMVRWLLSFSSIAMCYYFIAFFFRIRIKGCHLWRQKGGNFCFL
ncbi:MAG: hypothetical protein ACLP5H_31355 [Desulfomonilaceae bacterium]